MTDTEWAVVRPLLPVPGRLRGRGGPPEAYCHRAMLDAVRYLVDNGIKWRAMPADFPPWERVYAFFRRWRDHVLVKEFHDRLRSRIREREGRDTEPTAGVIDSQSVKADAVVGSDSRGFDGGKLINGQGFVVVPKRWIVERLFAHLMRTRRLVRDFERRTTSAEAMVYWPMILLMTRRLARP
ncbi:transposase [Streptomyces griseochromogenes]|uniref:Transposase n=1 Tax=Streptomyces griseochromogenes TaxID=68214 RepID=A0ABS4M298_9ACTN|nr:transposase [Streptomyces griseochromogenes]MBP2053796.1 transposase [Streptomyces griseochromogenes]